MQRRKFWKHLRLSDRQLLSDWNNFGRTFDAAKLHFRARPNHQPRSVRVDRVRDRSGRISRVQLRRDRCRRRSALFERSRFSLRPLVPDQFRDGRFRQGRERPHGAVRARADEAQQADFDGEISAAQRDCLQAICATER